MVAPRILIAGDDPTGRWPLRERLASWGYEVVEATDPTAAAATFAAHPADLVLLAVHPPEDAELPAIRVIRSLAPSVPVILMAERSELERAATLRLGAFDRIGKPVDFDALRVTLHYAREASLLRDEVQRCRDGGRRASLAGIVAEAPAMRSLIADLHEAALTAGRAILLSGEPGTGKDLMAALLHFRSLRAAGPFIVIHCNEVPPAFLESELFGHEREPGSEVLLLKRGALELADGGSLYLDDLGALAGGAQEKLLRFIETTNFRRVGGLHEITADVRVIVATGADPGADAAAGRLHAGLFLRLRMAAFRLPPLRERISDIPKLSNQFLREAALRAHKRFTSLSADALPGLCGHSWPANLRELKYTIDLAVVLADGDCIRRHHLWIGRRGADGEHRASFQLPRRGVSLEAVERSLVRQALQTAGGNQTRAAKLLQISRDALRYKLKKFGVQRPRDADERDAGSPWRIGGAGA